MLGTYARLGMALVVALGVAGVAAPGRTWAAPPAGGAMPPTVKAKTITKTMTKTGHRHHHHARRVPAQAVAPGKLQAAPVPPADTSAPVPNANLLPPREYVPPETSVRPGELQLHYPQVGQGYLPGSSPSAMDDNRAAKVPGVTVHVPIQPDTPQTLPPP